MSGEVYLRNSYGLNLQHKDNAFIAYTGAIAKDGDSTSTGMAFKCGRDSLGCG